MKHIKIGNKIFELASRSRRFSAFFIDIVHFAFLTIILSFILGIVGGIFLVILLFILEIIYLASDFPIWLSNFLNWAEVVEFHFLILGLTTMSVSFFIVLIRRPGASKMDLQVLRLDGKSSYSFIRALATFFQPLDIFCVFSREQQRLGDKLARTVVVSDGVVRELKSRKIEVKSGDPETVLETIIVEMKNWLSEAREKVDASIEVEKQFQAVHKRAVAQAERCYARASTALQSENEESARDVLRKRSGYLRLAEQSEKHCGEQKQVIGVLNNMLKHLQEKVMEVENRKAGVVAQQRNVDAAVHLRELLKQIQDNPLLKMEQDAAEVVALAKAATEVGIDYQEVELEREFARYAEEASIAKDLSELKAKLQ